MNDQPEVAPVVRWEPGDGFVTELNGRRYRLGGDPDAARRNFTNLIKTEDREAA